MTATRRDHGDRRRWLLALKGDPGKKRYQPAGRKTAAQSSIRPPIGAQFAPSKRVSCNCRMVR
jgi:hypothetical protein